VANLGARQVTLPNHTKAFTALLRVLGAGTRGRVCLIIMSMPCGKFSFFISFIFFYFQLTFGEYSA
jgi:hypothetical protein